MQKSKKNQNGSPTASGAMSIEPEDVVEGLLDAKDCLRAWPLFGPVRETRGYLKANRDRDSDDGPKAEQAPKADDGPTAEQDHRAIYEKNAMRLAYYLRNDMPEILNDIADRLDACADLHNAPQGSDDDRLRHRALIADDEQDDASPDDHDRDFSETDFVRRMTQAGNVEVPASFLRNLVELVQSLGNALDPQGDASLKLELTRRRSGKLPDPMSQLMKDSWIEMTVSLFGGKKEAGIQHVMDMTGWSRATICRALSRQNRKKGHRRRAPPAIKGHRRGRGAEPMA
jgi:hypothetical protein